MISASEAEKRFVLHYLPQAQPDLPSSRDALDWPQIKIAMGMVGRVTARLLQNGSTKDLLELMRGDSNRFADITIRFGKNYKKTWHINGNNQYMLDAIQKKINENPWCVVGQAFGHIEPD